MDVSQCERVLAASFYVVFYRFRVEVKLFPQGHSLDAEARTSSCKISAYDNVIFNGTSVDVYSQSRSDVGHT